MKTTKKTKKATSKKSSKSAKTARRATAPKKSRVASKKLEAKTAIATKGASGPVEVQILWGCVAYNASPEDAARTTVLDLAEHIAEGAPIPVIVRDEDGNEYRYEVSAG